MVIENCRNTLLLNIGHQSTKIKLNEFQFGKYIKKKCLMSNNLISLNDFGLMKSSLPLCYDRYYLD